MNRLKVTARKLFYGTNRWRILTLFSHEVWGVGGMGGVVFVLFVFFWTESTRPNGKEPERNFGFVGIGDKPLLKEKTVSSPLPK